jgi:quercetin dioxygenase-like cupin family protein
MNHITMLRAFTAALSCALVVPALAEGLPEGAVSLTPSQLTWKPGRVPGIENAALLGSSKGEGPYTERVRFPPHFVIRAHSHPDPRSYTILSGTWYIGYGDKFDEAKLQPLPAGSFYVEPAGVHHFVATKDEPVILQLSGIGPTATRFADSENAPK